MGASAVSIPANLRRVDASSTGRTARAADTVHVPREELEQAADIQRALSRSAIPNLFGAELRTLHRPAGAVSGDLVHIVRLDDSRVAMGLIDVTGHGIAAGMLALVAQRALRTVCGTPGSCTSPGEVLSRLNREWMDLSLRDCQFAAVLFAIYDESTRVIRWARGGMPYPVLFRDGADALTIVSEGPLVGILPDARFEEVEVQLRAGETLVLHTDGLEALLGDHWMHEAATMETETAHSSPHPENAHWIERRLRSWETRAGDSRSWCERVDDLTVTALHVPAKFEAESRQSPHGQSRTSRANLFETEQEQLLSVA